MPIFFPPTFELDARFHPDDPPYMQKLRARQKPNPTGINVWLLTDGSVTTTQPDNNDDIARWYEGGTYNEVTEDEAELLRGAGFTMLIED